MLPVALTALLLVGTIWKPFWIPGEDMKPALLPGDYLFSTREAGELPARGDVIVFGHPRGGQDYIKRVIGLPGDRVQMIDGVVHLNGAPLQTEAAGTLTERFEPQGPDGSIPRCANAPVAAGGDCHRDLVRETLPDGRSYLTLNIGDGFLDNTPILAVPEGHLFVMGDNRDNSMDSRVPVGAGGFGFVPVEHVRGRTTWILFSSAGALNDPLSWRPGRNFRMIR